MRCRAALEAAESALDSMRARAAELEGLLQAERGLVELIRKEKDELVGAIARKEKSQPLERYLPSEFEIQQQLARKVSAQKNKLKQLKEYLHTTKTSYNTLLQKQKYTKLERSQGAS